MYVLNSCIKSEELLQASSIGKALFLQEFEHRGCFKTSLPPPLMKATQQKGLNIILEELYWDLF